MALTPEDVVNKRFQPTKFREGYDQDEVDDFLDEVVVELRRLNQENEELRQRLIQSDSRINQLQQSGPPAPAMAAPVAAPMAPPAPVAAAAAAPAFNAGIDDQGSTNNLLQLARTLHEQHVREGIEKRDQLIAEGHATAERVVQEAEQQQRSALSSLQQERETLERRVEELRNFERDYRAKLKGYIESQLRELDEGTAPAPTQTSPQQASPYSTQPQQFGQPPVEPTAYEAPAAFEAPQAPYEQQAAPPAPAYGAPAPQQVPQGYPGFAGN